MSQAGKGTSVRKAAFVRRATAQVEGFCALPLASPCLAISSSYVDVCSWCWHSLHCGQHTRALIVHGSSHALLARDCLWAGALRVRDLLLPADVGFLGHVLVGIGLAVSLYQGHIVQVLGVAATGCASPAP